MTPQIPAEGILKNNDWGNAKRYQIVCECGDSDHDHTLWIEADETGVSVETFVTVKTAWWVEKIKPRYDIDNPWLQEFDWFWRNCFNGLYNRIKLTVDIWFKGYAEHETIITMNKQQALNYAETLKSAVKDVEEFQNTNKK
jgi:hypothetical protein